MRFVSASQPSLKSACEGCLAEAAQPRRRAKPMTFDDQLKHACDALTDRLRDEIERQVRAIAAELSAAAAAEREAAAADARAAATRDGARDIEAAVATARQDAHDAALAQGLADGRRDGHEEGQRDGRELGRREGFDEGRRSGFEDGRREGLEEGRRDGIVEGRQQGLEDARQQADAQPRAALADAAALERLAAAVRAVGRARSLTDILDALVQHSAEEAAYARVWVVRGAALRHWRSAGSGVPANAAAAPAAVGEAARRNAP